MIYNYEKVIQKQQELIAALQQQHVAGQNFINSQEQLIRSLHEKITLLEEEKRELANAGNEMSAACQKLDKLCLEQQRLIESFSTVFSEQ